MLAITYPAWTNQALCARLADVEAWFPHPGDNSAVIEHVVETCHRCPVRLKCLDYALDMERLPNGRPASSISRHGIYGGLSPRQREALARSAA